MRGGSLDLAQAFTRGGGPAEEDVTKRPRRFGEGVVEAAESARSDVDAYSKWISALTPACGDGQTPFTIADGSPRIRPPT